MAYTLRKSINGLSHADIKRINNLNPNMTLKELSNLTGYAKPFLEKLLLEPDKILKEHKKLEADNELS